MIYFTIICGAVIVFSVVISIIISHDREILEKYYSILTNLDRDIELDEISEIDAMESLLHHLKALRSSLWIKHMAKSYDPLIKETESDLAQMKANQSKNSND